MTRILLKKCTTCTAAYEFHSSGPDCMNPDNDRAQCPACMNLTLAARTDAAKARLRDVGVIFADGSSRRWKTAPSETPHKSQKRR